MKPCTRHEEIVQAVRAGHWPQGCTEELREHVADCTRCAEEARVLASFAAARHAAMRTTPMQSPGLLWWKAQLRRRHEAMTKLERPGFAISTATIVASILLLTAVLATAWKTIDFTHLQTIYTTGGWNIWMLAALAALLGTFFIAALVVSLGILEKRR